jgi:hypothetical protein
MPPFRSFERDPIPYALETDWPIGAAGFKPLYLQIRSAELHRGLRESGPSVEGLIVRSAARAALRSTGADLTLARLWGSPTDVCPGTARGAVARASEARRRRAATFSPRTLARGPRRHRGRHGKIAQITAILSDFSQLRSLICDVMSGRLGRAKSASVLVWPLNET